MSEDTQEFYKKPSFIASAATALVLLLFPIISIKEHSISLFDMFDLPLGFIYKMTLLAAIIMSILNAYLIYDNGKNEKLNESLKPKMREKLKFTPIIMLGVFVVNLLIDELPLGLGDLGIGVWLGLLASAFLAFENKIMPMIKK